MSAPSPPEARPPTYDAPPQKGDPPDVPPEGGVWVRRSDVHGAKPEPDAFRMVFASDAERHLEELQVELRELQEALETICDIGETRDVAVARAALKKVELRELATAEQIRKEREDFHRRLA